jgi:hypothetical protein
MITFAHKTALAMLAALTVVSFASLPAVASQPKALLLSPGVPSSPSIYLPKFGFSSFNIGGVGERVTYVTWNGLAAQLGLEPGDLILSMNGFPLNYHGSWNDALYQAVVNGGWVQLTIRDVRTGFIAYRETFVGGGYGPITPKYHVGYGNVVGPNTSHMIHQPHGNHGHGGMNLKKFAKLIDKIDD